MKILQEILAAKAGNKEFVLEGDGDFWCAAIGNRSSAVGIGEAIGYGEGAVEFRAKGKTAVEALANLRDMVVAAG